MKQLRLQIFTWNVAGLTTIDESKLSQLFSFENDVGFYIVSLQEIATGVVETALSFLAYDGWTRTLLSIMSKHHYYMVENVRVQGMSLSLFARLSHLPYTRFIKSDIRRTGLGGNWGNKGGVAISSNIFGKRICFLDTHLPAQVQFNDIRIEHFNDIVEFMEFDRTATVLSHDVVFWAGDSNFRIDDIPRQEVLKMVEEKTYEELLKKDQLKKQLRQHGVMKEFVEGLISFPPSFKLPSMPYHVLLLLLAKDLMALSMPWSLSGAQVLIESRTFDMGTDTYDTSEKQRKPAWTDRILYRVNPDGRSLQDALRDMSITTASPTSSPTLTRKKTVVQLVDGSYKSFPHMKQSDHKPVGAEYLLHIEEDPGKLVQLKVEGRWQSDGYGEVVIHFSNNMTPDGRDYLALYEKNFTDFRSYKTWAYVPVTSQENASKSQRCKFPLIHIQETSQYRIGYYCERMSCLLALSEPLIVYK